MCHGKAGVGTAMAPNLHGAFGAKAGAANAPRNSAALKASKLTWNAANLDAYPAAPAKRVPGTNMPVAVANPTDRKNLIAYSATLTNWRDADGRVRTGLRLHTFTPTHCRGPSLPRGLWVRAPSQTMWRAPA